MLAALHRAIPRPARELRGERRYEKTSDRNWAGPVWLGGYAKAVQPRPRRSGDGQDEVRVQEVMGQTTHALSGDATNEHVLRELGVVDYDAAIVAIGLDIMSSVMTSVLLKTLGVPYVVSRAHNELHANTLERIGVDKVVEVESEMGVRLAHSLFNPTLRSTWS